MPRYHVLTIGDAYDFGAIGDAGATSYVVTTSRDPLRVHATPGTNTPAIGLLAKGSTVTATGEIAQADGQSFARVLHPTLKVYGWSDLRYLAAADSPAEQAAKQAEADAAQASADAIATSTSAPTPAQTLPTPPKPAGVTPAQVTVSASVGGWTIAALVAAAAAIWYVSRDKK